MTERWQRELKRLSTLEMPRSVEPRMRQGPRGTTGPLPSQRVLAIIVAFAIFLAGTAYLLRAFAGHVRPAGQTHNTVEVIPVDPGPTNVVFWNSRLFVEIQGFGQGAFSGLLEIDPETNRIVARIPLATSGPIAVGEGALWGLGLTNCNAGVLQRYDLATGETSSFRLPCKSEPSSIAVGLGSVWVVERGTSAVMRLDPTTGRVQARFGFPVTPQQVWVGNGAVWVNLHPSTRSTPAGLVQLSTGSRIRVLHSFSLDYANDLAFAPGTVWVNEGRTIARIDLDSGKVSDVIADPYRANGMAWGGGTLWLRESSSLEQPGRILRLDPATGAIGPTAYQLPPDANGSIAYGAGALWVTRGSYNPAPQYAVARINLQPCEGAACSVPPSPPAPAPNRPLPDLPSIDWSHPNGTMEISANALERYPLPFGAIDPVPGLGNAVSIWTRGPNVRISDRSGTWVYEGSGGRFWVAERRSSVSEETFLKTYFCQPGEIGCSDTGRSVIRLSNGIGAAVLDGSAVGCGTYSESTYVEWIQGAVDVTVMGPCASFTKAEAVRIANVLAGG